MNQQQLFEKYKNSRFTNAGVENYINDLHRELNEILKNQKDKTVEGLASAVREINDLHNKVMDLFIEMRQHAPLIKDAYLVCSKALHPEIKRFF